MKISLSLILLLLFFQNSKCQTSSIEKHGFGDFSSFNIELKAPKSVNPVSLSFSGLEVHDKRNDSSFVGFYKIKASTNKSWVTILKTEKPTASSLYSFLEPQIAFDNQASYKLVLLIRKLWLSKEIENDEVRDYNIKMQKPLLPGILTGFEFYAKRDMELIPLFRFDSTILHYKQNLSLIDEELLKVALISAIDKLSKSNYEQKIKTGKKYSLEQIDSFSTITKRIDILQTESRKKGVYLTYDEFKNNRPSIHDFEIKKSEYAHTLYVKDNQGNQYPLRKIWGFSDGENLFIKSADIFFKLEKFNNNFYCWASKNVSMVTKIPVGDIIGLGLLSVAGGNGGNAGRKTKAALFLKLYQLDLETGKLY